MLFAGGAGDWTKLASLNAPLPEAMKNMVSPSSPGSTCSFISVFSA